MSVNLHHVLICQTYSLYGIYTNTTKYLPLMQNSVDVLLKFTEMGYYIQS